MIPCVICHELIRVPVQLTCFPCALSGGLDTLQNECNEIVRVCLLCARDYLQLDMPSTQRVAFRKCLICERSVNPRQFVSTTENVYRKDKMLMSLDTRKNIPCFRTEEDKCEFTGTQNELDRHLQQECPGRTVVCKGGCGETFKSWKEKDHQATCTFYTSCAHCVTVQPMLDEELRTHMFQLHKEVRCQDCKIYIHESRVVGHRKECPKRVVNCVVCKKSHFFVDMKKHLSEHIRFQAQEISTLTSHIQSQQTILKTAIEQLEKY